MATTPGDSPGDVLGSLVETLQANGISPVAVTGGIAFGVWVSPRYTRDFDLCAVVPDAAVDRILARYDGIRVGPERLPTIMRFSFRGWDVDLFVVHTAYDRECMNRAVGVEVFGARVKVVTAEDLLIHKLIKLRSDKRRLLQDASDIRALVEAQGAALEEAHLQKWLPATEWQIVSDLPDLDDEALVRRLKTV